MSLDQTVLKATPRVKHGKGPARQLRMKGLIPAVVYGPFSPPMGLAVDPVAVKTAINTPHKFNTVITLEIEGGAKKTVLFKDWQTDPVERNVIHADFQEIQLDKPVRVDVPLVMVGRAAGAAEGGILQIARRVITVEALPKDIPHKIDVDVSSLKIAESLHISDVTAPAGVRFIYATNFTIAVVGIPEKEEVAAVVAAAPGAEGAAAAGAPGAPAAAGAVPATKVSDKPAEGAPEKKGGGKEKK